MVAGAESATPGDCARVFGKNFEGSGAGSTATVVVPRGQECGVDEDDCCVGQR